MIHAHTHTESSPTVTLDCGGWGEHPESHLTEPAEEGERFAYGMGTFPRSGISTQSDHDVTPKLGIAYLD